MFVKHSTQKWDYLLHVDLMKISVIGSITGTMHYFKGGKTEIDRPYKISNVVKAIESGEWVVVANDEAANLLSPDVNVGDFVHIEGEGSDLYLVAKTGNEAVQLISLKNGNRWSSNVCKVGTYKFKLSLLEKAFDDKLKIVDRPL